MMPRPRPPLVRHRAGPRRAAAWVLGRTVALALGRTVALALGRTVALALGRTVALALGLGLAATAQAWDLAGTRTLVAQLRGQPSVVLGTVTFTPQADGRIAFSVAMDASRFTDHFLSMKEFKCLDAAGELLCHVPYPYPQPGSVTETDLAWLEHALLFLFKKPGEFGARLWNGLYFKFERTPGGLVGRPQAIDLNLISAPPDKPGVPPYRPALRDDVPEGARAIERLRIE